MNSEHSATDSGSGIDSESESGRMSRRRYIAGLGTLAVVGLAGCSGGESESQSGSGGNASGSEGSSESVSDENQREAEEQAEDDSDGGDSSDVNPEDVEQGEDLLEYNGLVLNEHESQPYESLDWFSVVGIVENTTDETVDYVEVKVRAYDADGNQIESVFTNTTDLQAGGTWKFEVTATSDYDEVDDYDIRISDSPF